MGKPRNPFAIVQARLVRWWSRGNVEMWIWSREDFVPRFGRPLLLFTRTRG